MNDIFLARQPIFDRKGKIFAYELLYRSGLENFYTHSNGDQATSTVLAHSFLSIGLEEITYGKMAFINFTQNLLVNEVATIFPEGQMAVEILEDVEPEPEVLEQCRKLKDMGYWLVLDDFIYNPKLEPFIELANIIKIEVLGKSEKEVKDATTRFELKNVKLLAEKVETHEQHQNALELGYSYFQGYFFAKPDVIQGKELHAYKLNYLRVLQQVSRPGIDFKELEEIFKQDVSLSYKLLKYINSPYFGIRKEIKSIKHALSMIGLKGAKQWLSLIALASIGKNKSEELVRISLVRANLCESIAPLFGFEEEAPELFIMGMFSLIDAFLNKPMADALAELPVSDKIKKPLLGEESPYKVIYNVMLAYEKGQWDRVFHYLNDTEAILTELPELFNQTIKKTNNIYAGSFS